MLLCRCLFRILCIYNTPFTASLGTLIILLRISWISSIMFLRACFTFAVAVTGATAQSSSAKLIFVGSGVTVRPTQTPSADVSPPTAQSSTARSTFIRPGVSVTATVEPCARISSAAAAYSSTYPSGKRDTLPYLPFKC